MDVDFIPVVVEGATDSSFISTLKFMAPANMTMLQLVDNIRARLKLPIAVHLMLGKGFTVLMSQSIGLVHRDNKSESGLLHLSCVTENVFGCIPPRKKPVKRVFPGQEALPFGAPEPYFGLYDIYDEEELDAELEPVNPEMWNVPPIQGVVLQPAHTASGVAVDWFQVLSEEFGFNSLANNEGEVIIPNFEQPAIPSNIGPLHLGDYELTPVPSNIGPLYLSDNQITEDPSDEEEDPTHMDALNELYLMEEDMDSSSGTEEEEEL